jgi:hypothetical protein
VVLSPSDRDFVTTLRQAVDDSASRMLAIGEEQAGLRPAPGKWSRKEILGHLIDSAVNNQARFVRAQQQADLVFDGYDQDVWVRVQRYQERPWPELIQIWCAYNHQIAATMRDASIEELERLRPRHNLQDIGFQPLPPDTAPTLAFLMRDYVVHLQHHLRQLMGR